MNKEILDKKKYEFLRSPDQVFAGGCKDAREFPVDFRRDLLIRGKSQEMIDLFLRPLANITAALGLPLIPKIVEGQIRNEQFATSQML